MRRILPFLLILSACGSPDDAPIAEPSARGSTLEIVTSAGVVEVDVEIADEQGERSVGLMHREQLDADAGMVFLWSDPLHTTFWMKDTLIPLSIAFWDERGRIVSILDMEPCTDSERCPSYDPETEFLGALEVNRGFFDEHGVDVGDEVRLR
jgi:uncharacterized membrane protein (UPF0127 family)